MVTKMQAELTVRCDTCNERLGRLLIDTASMPEELGHKLSIIVSDMQIRVSIRCHGCESWLGDVIVDRSCSNEQIQQQINVVILAHRKNCDCYRQRDY